MIHAADADIRSIMCTEPPDDHSIEFGRPVIASPSGGTGHCDVPPKRFLSVWFRCCHVYGRMYRSRDQTEYTGRCPKCGAWVRAMIGPDGTNRRVFEAR